MSDEYGRTGFKDSLVDESINLNPEGTTVDERFKNYPPENDSMRATLSYSIALMYSNSTTQQLLPAASARPKKCGQIKLNGEKLNHPMGS
ncbi:hypothetical protein HHX47_DHR10000411 [Lentinula edodes]|nr:hypothetical protein HHX47_DHR10000411 [Lentinula edodes]